MSRTSMTRSDGLLAGGIEGLPTDRETGTCVVTLRHDGALSKTSARPRSPSLSKRKWWGISALSNRRCCNATRASAGRVTVERLRAGGAGSKKIVGRRSVRINRRQRPHPLFSEHLSIKNFPERAGHGNHVAMLRRQPQGGDVRLREVVEIHD